jgi:hypothetical protein
VLGLAITAVARHEKAFGPDHLRTLRCRAVLARLRMELGQAKEAGALLAQCLASAEVLAAAGGPCLAGLEVAELQDLLGRTQWETGRWGGGGEAAGADAVVRECMK